MSVGAAMRSSVTRLVCWRTRSLLALTHERIGPSGGVTTNTGGKTPRLGSNSRSSQAR
jgi:hypothetical protein